MEAIAKLEAVAPSAWSQVAILKEFERDDGVLLAAFDGRNGPVIGWCCALQVADEAELLKVSVSTKKRRQGVATALLVQLKGECWAQGVAKLYLEVRSQNRAARALYERDGFSQLSVRKGYYRNPKDDAVVYVKNITPKQNDY